MSPDHLITEHGRFEVPLADRDDLADLDEPLDLEDRLDAALDLAFGGRPTVDQWDQIDARR